MSDDKKDSEKKRKAGEPAPWTAKRFIALAAIIFLAGLYVLTLVAALFTDSAHPALFRFTLGMTIAVPIFAWILIYAIGLFTKRHTIASPDILNSSPGERQRMEQALRRHAEDQSADGRESVPGKEEARKQR